MPVDPMVVVFGLIAVALVLFVTELISNDMTAIGVLVALAVLEPVTGVSSVAAISGFASPATVTIVAMYVLSAGIQETGIVDRLGVVLARITGGDESRLLLATIGSTGVTAGIINNTPVVAVFIPMITGLADRYGISPSKLLLPLSYAAMLGGTLTLIGTSTNILAGDLSRELLDHPISMFEFTPIGVVALVVGSAYLLTVGRRLTPARIPPSADVTESFGLEDHLTQVAVKRTSPLVGESVESIGDDDVSLDLDVLQVDRDDGAVVATSSDRPLAVGDVLTVRGHQDAVTWFADAYDLRVIHYDVTEAELRGTEDEGIVVEVVLPTESRLVGETVAETRLDEQFDTIVLAIRRGDGVIREGIDEAELEEGDTLLLQTTEPSIEFLTENGDVVVTAFTEESDDLVDPDVPDETIAPLSPKTPIAVGIMAAVILLAAVGVVPIVIAALGGMVAMIATGCLTSTAAYDAVSWNVIFLLAGVLPLGVAMQNTGGDALIAGHLTAAAEVVPVVGVLVLFYLLTGLLANVITPVASVVLMIPIAVDTAARIPSADGFPFLLAVMFAGSSAFMTPIGYQTNLMVYGPGGYRFSDFLRVGGPLQLLLAVVVTGAIAVVYL